MPYQYQESWGNQNLIEQSETLSQAGLTCNKTGFYVHKLDIFISWQSFYASHSMKRFLRHSEYSLNNNQLTFLRWYFMVYVDDTPRIYAIRGDDYIELIGTLAKTRLRQLLERAVAENDCIDRLASRLYDQHWIIYGRYEDNLTPQKQYMQQGEIKIKKNNKKRGKRGGKKHKK